jgi:hypothetical protein
MQLTREMLDRLAQGIAATYPEEIDCNEWLSRVGRLVEILSRGVPVPPDLEPLLQHIQVCAECREELELLLAMMKEKD